MSQEDNQRFLLCEENVRRGEVTFTYKFWGSQSSLSLLSVFSTFSSISPWLPSSHTNADDNGFCTRVLRWEDLFLVFELPFSCSRKNVVGKRTRIKIDYFKRSHDPIKRRGASSLEKWMFCWKSEVHRKNSAQTQLRRQNDSGTDKTWWTKRSLSIFSD